MALKTYTFTLDIKKNKKEIEWIREQQENELNLSAFVRSLLKQEIKRRIENVKKIDD